MASLPASFYQRSNVQLIARQLLGKILHTKTGTVHTAALICEVEAYAGLKDRASHTYNGRRTARNEVMWGPGGRAYVYLCYGMHHLLNFVTNREGIAQAVLIRGLEPLQGEAYMLKRRKMSRLVPRLTAGPGALSQAMGITVRDNAVSLQGPKMWVENARNLKTRDIVAGPRIGVDFAGPDARLQWRYWIKHSDWVSKPR